MTEMTKKGRFAINYLHDDNSLLALGAEGEYIKVPCLGLTDEKISESFKKAVFDKELYATELLKSGRSYDETVQSVSKKEKTYQEVKEMFN